MWGTPVLWDAVSHGANLYYADLRGANLRDTDLSGATSWTVAQLEQAASLEGAAMPNGQRVPNGQKYEDWLKSKRRGEDEENTGA